MPTILPMTVPTCACCAEPTALLPRPDLAEGLAACGTTGNLYRREGTGYALAPMPDLPARHAPAPVPIDLSRVGYS